MSEAGHGGFTPHFQREELLNEAHARPFYPAPTPWRVLHFAFLTDGDEAAAARADLITYCRTQGLPVPHLEAKHHRVAKPGLMLRFEQHSEFTTYTFGFDLADRAPFETQAGMLVSGLGGLSQPGPHLVSIDLHLVAEEAALAPEDIFDPASLAASLVHDGAGLVATDFKADAEGFVRILVVDRELGPARAGSLVQRVLEIETYRMLALLGLPEAQRIGPHVRRVEEALARITGTMTRTEGLESDNRLLAELTALAADVEAEAVVAGFRFGASRAYDGIVMQRLEAIGETNYSIWPSVSAFLNRRMGPAMRTCRMLEERQTNLSLKLARAANLLRTRVDVEIERQNRDLLRSMNLRSRMQLRLQQTVEGLSIAAISYYVVGLAAYVFKGLAELGFQLDPALATTLTVPIAILFVGTVVWRIRHRHRKMDAHGQD